jgi:hypothetical protein
MKKSNVMSVAMLLMLLSIMLFATGCAKQSTIAGTDWYDAVPEVEHERRFPHGHKQIPGPNYENCVYNEKTKTYFCQFAD